MYTIFLYETDGYFMENSEKPNKFGFLKESPQLHQKVIPALTHAASHQGSSARKLSCGIQALEECLGGGLPVGALIEWGAPMGQGGRELLMPWIREVTNPVNTSSSPSWALWVYTLPRLIPFAPAWAARGVALERLRFAQTTSPLRDLQPVFMEPLFRMIVLDVSQTFSPDEYAFLTRQARHHDQTIVVVQDRLLSPETGNVWARLRVNTRHLAKPHHYQLEILKGSSIRHKAIALV